MKYVIIQEPDGSEFPVFCVAPQTHAELATAWRRNDSRKVVAAGFVEFLATGAALVFGRSTSLDLGPRPRDAALITTFTMATLTMARSDEASEVGSAGRPPGLREISPALRDEIAAQVAQLHPPAAPHRAAV